MTYTIDKFWTKKFQGLVREHSQPSAEGWSSQNAPNPSFVEADLRLRAGFEDLGAPVWFVAAPGAVGKSTLAKQISANTGAIYLDLAKADTVAGNYLTGGLVKNKIFSLWEKEQATVLIDALDEARLRVTQSSFIDFLNDVHAATQGRKVPTVFFGRVGIVEEAWLVLYEAGLACPIFDIDFFDRGRSEQFVMAALDRLAKSEKYKSLRQGLTSHRSVYQQAAAKFVSGLENVTASDGARFSGYAPVLEAVATALAEVTNPGAMDDAIQKSIQGNVLHDLTNQILMREASKLRLQLPESMPSSIRDTLYGPEEQLARLAGLIYQIPSFSPSVPIPQEFVGSYNTAVEGFMPNHPFLDGTGRSPSGAVFAAAINGRALFSKSPEILAAAQRHAGNGPHTPNPFLVDFYLKQSGNNPLILPEHVIALYESVRARAAAGDTIRLTIDGDEGDDEADVEIQIAGSKGGARRIVARTSQAGTLLFGRQVNAVSVDAPQMDVVIGSGNPVELVAPVSLNIAKLTFECQELVVTKGEQSGESEDGVVVIDARELGESKVSNAPIVRKGTELSVSWPGASAYPWSNFVGAPSGSNGKDINEALRSFRRLVLAFRSHSKGELARFRDKIEHARMTKGALGIAIRERMLNDKILRLSSAEEMYFLDPTALGKIAGANYHDLKLKRFNDQVRAYVSSIEA